MAMRIRRATPSDARDLARLINLAGEGLPEYLWRNMAESTETPWQTGTRRAARDEGNFSYTNALICEDGNSDEVLGMVLAYRQPDPYDIGELSDYPEAVRPLLLLESQTPGHWYINAIATYAPHRGKGVASQLMAATEAQGREQGCRTLSLIVASGNAGAKAMYEHLGYARVDARPIVPYPGCLHGGDWVLMSKPALA